MLAKIYFIIRDFLFEDVAVQSRDEFHFVPKKN